MDTNSFGFVDFIDKIAPSLILIIGIWVGIHKIGLQHKWQQNDKLSDLQEKYFEDIMRLMADIEDSELSDKKLLVNLQYFFIKSLRLFDKDAISNDLETAINLINPQNSRSENAGDPPPRNSDYDGDIIGQLLASHLKSIIDFLKSNK